MDPVTVYDLGQQGVNLVVSPLHQRAATEVIRAQNAIFDKDSDAGGLTKRGGTAKLSAAALNGGAAIRGAIHLPLPDPDTAQATIYVLVEVVGSGNNFWLSSTNGTTWTLAAATITGTDGAVLPNFQLATYYEGAVTPFGRAYVLSALESGASPNYERLARFDGRTTIPLSRSPEDQAGTGVHATNYNSGTDGLYYFDGRVYFALEGVGGSVTSARVMGMNTSTEAAIQIGNAFGAGGGTRVTPVTFPVVFQEFLGRLFFFPWENASTNRNYYWIRPDIDTAWTSDHDPGANQQPTGAAVFNGVLYVCTKNSVGSAIVESRTANGTWATSETSPAASTDYVALAEFNSLLFALTQDGSTAAVRVFNGATWSADETFAGVNTGVLLRTYGAYLYAFTSRNIYRRDTAGTWTLVHNAAAASQLIVSPIFYLTQ
jgi:hypothetical protein